MITVYSKEGCIWCERAATLLQKLRIPFKKVPTSKDGLEALTGLESPTYPQVYDGRRRVGGFDDLRKYLGLYRVEGATWRPPGAARTKRHKKIHALARRMRTALSHL